MVMVPSAFIVSPGWLAVPGVKFTSSVGDGLRLSPTWSFFSTLSVVRVLLLGLPNSNTSSAATKSDTIIVAFALAALDEFVLSTIV